jgi:hypothetical protein
MDLKSDQQAGLDPDQEWYGNLYEKLRDNRELSENFNLTRGAKLKGIELKAMQKVTNVI